MRFSERVQRYCQRSFFVDGSRGTRTTADEKMGTLLWALMGLLWGGSWQVLSEGTKRGDEKGTHLIFKA